MSSSNGRWRHADLVTLFTEAGSELKPTKSGKEYKGGHPHRHDSRSGTCMVVWPEDSRWYCSSCHAKGDAADFLVDVGKAVDRQEAELILTERFGPPYTPERPHLTDLGNAQRLIEAYGDRLRHCWPWNKWLVWDGIRWALDDSGIVFSYAKSISKKLYLEAGELANRAAMEADEARRETLGKQATAVLSWAKQSETKARIDSMISLARSEPGIPVLPKDMDTDPWLLNVLNGVLDLRAGKLLPHNSKRLITKLAPVRYNPKAPCPIWESVLHRSMAGNPNLIGFLQKGFGYGLTGDVSEQIFFVFYGSGANGKGTITNCLLEMMGDYATKATPELLMARRGASHPTERTKLFGARLVLTAETEENQRLAEAFVKEATGGDPITARRMKEDFWTFFPTHKIFLATNHKPVIRGTDHAIWRRPKLVPFNVTIPRAEWDTKLPDRLKDEWPGILAWAVRGCLEWQKTGLGIPHEVETATQNYRNEMDIFGSFLMDRGIIGPDRSINTSDLYSAYREWCSEQGILRPWTQKDVSNTLIERGFTPKHTNRGNRWLGLDLRGPDEDLPCSDEGIDLSPFTPKVKDDGSACEHEFGAVKGGEANFGVNQNLDSRIEVNPKNPSPPFTLHPFSVLTDPAQARNLAETLAAEKYVGLDLETTGLDPHHDRIRLVQLATPEQTWLIDAYRVPITELKAVLAGGPVKIVQNAKFDWQFLYAQGIWMGPVFDTMLADQVIHHRSFGRGLGDLARDYLDMELPKELQTSDWSGELNDEQVSYAARDAGVLPSLASAIMVRVRDLKLQKVVDLENKALPGIAWMEYQGVGFDLDAWQVLADRAEAKVKELGTTLEQLAFESAGLHSIDWDSPKQVLEALNQIGVAITDTKEESLQVYKQTHPIVAVLLDYREMSKRASTYGVDWLRHVNMETGRIRADWKQIGAESGRMACKDPNMQNLPRSKDYRACFTADPGKVFIKADYSQIEIRVAAEISGDRNLLQAFQNGQDIHVLAATYITGKNADAITPEERQLAKAVNFGLIYGLGAKRLAVQAGQDYGIELSEERATEIRNRYFKAFSGLREWQHRQGKETITRTLSGRYRDWVNEPPYTQLLNTPVQGTGADGMKLALAELWKTWTPDLEGCYPVMVIHDELLVEAPEDRADKAAEWVRNAMTSGMSGLLNQVPVEAEIVVCRNYAGDDGWAI